MFGFPRLMDVVGSRRGSGEVIDRVLTELGRFTPPDGEQEDDITLVALRRLGDGVPTGAPELDVIFSIPSARGNERLAMDSVAEAVAPVGLDPRRLEQLKTAVSEAAMNAIEHGNGSDPDVPVDVHVRRSGGELSVAITDRGGSDMLPEAETPDLEAKLDGRQKTRGWGLFLIRNMVDDVRESGDGDLHTIELVLDLEGDDDAGD